jgi:hypothetical protein
LDVRPENVFLATNPVADEGAKNAFLFDAVQL